MITSEVVELWEILGNAYGALGEPQKAQKFLERALPIFEKHYGPDHFKVARVLVSLGNAYKDLCNPHKAKELLERALAIQKKHYGPDHFEVARTLANLGSVDKILEKPYKSSNKIEKTHKNLSSLVKSRKNAPKVLDFSKEAFNQMTFFVDMLIVIPLYFSIPSWWNNYYTSLAFKTCNKSITIVAFISH